VAPVWPVGMVLPLPSRASVGVEFLIKYTIFWVILPPFSLTMACARSPKTQRVLRRQRKQKNGLALMLLAVGAVALHVYPSLKRKPENTSKLTGQEWIEELLAGHPGRFRANMGMNKHVFLRLLAELGERSYLGPTKWASSEEQFGIFLYTCVTGLSMTHVKERFQRSKDTISKYVF
jgi:hypothetical protein